MTRAMLLLGLVAGLAAPAAAQLLGEPLWNSPTGGGFAISADYAKPNSNYGGGTTWGARLSFGLGTTTFTLGAASWEGLTSIGANAGFRLSGGSLLPTASPGIWSNLQLGVGHTEETDVLVSPSATVVTGAVGVGVRLPAPAFTVEPYFSPGIRHRSSVPGGGSSTQFGYATGANVEFGSWGVHLAYDNEQTKGGGNIGVFGLGAHLTP
jgi:hypothetical protein